MPSNNTKKIHYLVFFSFFLIGAIVYSNTLNVPFYFDDYPNIQDPALKMDYFSMETIKEAVSQGKLKGRPLANLSFALNYLIHGYNVQGYHIVNIVIHILNAFILYNFVLLTLTIPINNTSYKNAQIIAYVTSLLWLVHPLGTQSVTYIVQRMNSLAFMFYLLSMNCYISLRIKQKYNGPVTSLWIYKRIILSILFGILAMSSKEIAATLPIMVLLYEWFFFQDLKIKLTKSKILWLTLAFSVIVCLLYLYLGDNPWRRIFATTCAYRDFTVYERVLTQFRVILHYISLVFFPHPERLVFDYNFGTSTSLFHPITTFYAFTTLVSLIISAILTSKKERLISFCIICFFLTLAVESSIICLDMVYEHRTYLPSIFIILLLIITISKVIKNSFVIVCLLIIALPLASWTYERNQTWQDPLVFWSDSVRKNPNKPRSLNNLGNAYYYKNNYKEAIKSYKKALDITPDYLPTLKNISIAYDKLEDHRNTEKYCRIALDYAPNFVDVLNILALTLYKQDRAAESDQLLKKAIQINPDYAMTNKNYGYLLLRDNKPDQALKYLKKASLFRKQDIVLLLNLGEAYVRTEQFSQAIKTYKNVLKKNNNTASAHYNLARILSATGKEKEAAKHYKSALELDEFYIPALYNYGNLLFRSGKYNKALELYKTIITMRPEIANAYNNIGLIMLQNGKNKTAKDFFQEALQIMPENDMFKRNIDLLESEDHTNHP